VPIDRRRSHLPELIAEAGRWPSWPALRKPLPAAGVSSKWTTWDSDFLDLVEEGHLTFEGKSEGEIAFGALKGFLDVRYYARDGSACAEFSWEGHDENDPACGRGWVSIGAHASRSVLRSCLNC
jgi:hypothetical protein